MKEFLGTKKNSYRKITDIEREGDERFYDLTRKKDEYWTLDHNTMKYFEEIEEIAKPTEWGDLDRLLEGFLYHSQYQEYGHQCYELVRDKLGEELDELFFILRTTHGKSIACKRRRINYTLSQGTRYKHERNKNRF